jgi:hypothetical protein
MKQYWMGIDQAMEKLNSHAGSFYGLQQIYTPEFLSKCEALLAQAAEAAKGDTAYEQRVALHTEGFRSALQYRQISDQMQAGQFGQANELLTTMTERLHRLGQQRLANAEYATSYVDRFLSKSVRAAAAATAAPNKVLQVLPKDWRFAIDEKDEGVVKNYAAAELDDSKWAVVSTYPQTLDVQGKAYEGVMWYRSRFNVPAGHGKLALFFGEVDGQTEVFVNGKKVAVPAPPAGKKGPVDLGGAAKARLPFEVEVTQAVRDGENVVALRVDHSKMTDLALGGILRPVVVVEKP